MPILRSSTSLDPHVGTARCFTLVGGQSLLQVFDALNWTLVNGVLCAGVRLRPPTIAVATRLPWTSCLGRPGSMAVRSGTQNFHLATSAGDTIINSFFQPNGFHGPCAFANWWKPGVQWLGSGPGGVWSSLALSARTGSNGDSTAVAPLPSRQRHTTAAGVNGARNHQLRWATNPGGWGRWIAVKISPFVGRIGRYHRLCRERSAGRRSPFRECVRGAHQPQNEGRVCTVGCSNVTGSCDMTHFHRT